MNLDTPWSDILKKEATGIDDCDLGKVQRIGQTLLLPKKVLLRRRDIAYQRILLRVSMDIHCILE